MQKFSLEQLRAILEARVLTKSFECRALSHGEKLMVHRQAKIIANLNEPLGPYSEILAGISKAGPVDPLPEVSSTAIIEEMRSRQKVIYGSDDRVEAVDAQDAHRRRHSRSVAAIFERNDLVALQDGTVSVGGASFADRFAAKGKPLCALEDFRDQPNPAIGTAFLVAPSVIATANHCLNKETFPYRCLVFDFEVDGSGHAATSFHPDQIYLPKKYYGGSYSKEGADWALLELDRPVADRSSLSLRQSGKVGNTDPLYVIGHPSGLPKKIAGEAEVRANEVSTHFTANLDTYGGNSGSPVFNAITHKVEGILVRGETDFVPLGDCYSSLVCPVSGCRGEDCSRIEPVVKKLSEVAQIVHEIGGIGDVCFSDT